MNAFAPPGQQLGHRMLGQPVHLQVRAQLAQLVGDGQVPPRVPEPNRRRQVQHRGGGGPAALSTGAAQAGSGRNRLAKSRIAWLTTTGSRACGQCPAPSTTSRSAPVSSAIRSLHDSGAQRSWSPWIASTGQRTCRSSRSVSSFADDRHRRVIMRQHRLRACLHRPADAVLALLARMRLAEQFAEEELGESAPVAQPVVPVVLRPAFVGVQDLVEVIDGLVGRQRQVRDRRSDSHHAQDTLGVQGGHQQR